MYAGNSNKISGSYKNLCNYPVYESVTENPNFNSMPPAVSE